MKEFIDKLKIRLEEQIKIEESIAKSETEGHPITHQYASNCLKLFRNQVNQLAEEYKDKVMIDGQYCWQTCSATEHCKECRRLGSGDVDYYENIGEYINCSTDTSTDTSNGWIPCSERLPNDDSMCLVTVEYSSGRIEVNYGWFDRVGVCWYVGMHEFRTTNVHAWMPLPAPYTEGE